MKKKLITSILALALVLALTACAAPAQPSPSPPVALTDRAGFSITAPATSERIVALAPSLCEILVGLDKGGSIIAYTTYSTDVEGLSQDLPAFDMTAPDVEQILALEPDLVLVSSLSLETSDDPLMALKDLGICVAYIPTSESLAGIYEDIRLIAQLVGKADEGEALVSSMQADIDAVKQVAATIPEAERKTVLFEVAAAPYIYSFGSGTYMNELIEAVGAVNVLADQQSWLPVSEEAAVDANPDVILTSVNYIDDPVGEILGRAGFAEVTAVKNQAVYTIDTNASNRSSQLVLKALHEMAVAVYPEYFN